MEETYYFDHLFQMNRKTTKSKLENMNQEINKLIAYIKSKNLSPIEEIMFVYDYVKQFESAKMDTSLETRQVDGVLDSKKAVCAGYANAFNEILIKMGYKAAVLESFIGNISHMFSIVEIDDPKYGISGIYNFDAMFDSLDKSAFSEEQRENSYVFFGKTFGEINCLKNQRIPRGCSIAIMKGPDASNYDEVLEEIPLRTMNIINGFFPSEENQAYLNTIYQQGNDKNNWKKLNEPYLSQLDDLGSKYRSTEQIPIETLEAIIINVQKAKNPFIIHEELISKINRIKTLTILQTKKYYNSNIGNELNNSQNSRTK